MLILAVLYVFLRDIRAALIAFTAIPLSLLAAMRSSTAWAHAEYHDARGISPSRWASWSTMPSSASRTSCGACARISLLAQPPPRLDVIREASLEVRGPVIYATAVVIAVFLPEIFTSSVQGRFVGPLALAFIFAVLASLLVAMTTTPALCALLLRGHDARPDRAGWSG